MRTVLLAVNAEKLKGSKSTDKFTNLERKPHLALAGFHAGPLPCSNWNLEMLAFCRGGKTGELGEKPSEHGENQPQSIHV